MRQVPWGETRITTEKCSKMLKSIVEGPGIVYDGVKTESDNTHTRVSQQRSASTNVEVSQHKRWEKQLLPPNCGLGAFWVYA